MNNETSNQELLNRLADSYGILPFYWDVQGQQHFASDETKQSILRALGVPCGTREEIETSLLRYEKDHWCCFCEPVAAFRQEELPVRLKLRCSESNLKRSYHWKLAFEKKGIAEGSFTPAETRTIEEHELSGEKYYGFELILPVSPPMGYHKLTFSLSDQETSEETKSTAKCLLIVSPNHCYLPPALDQGKKVWGVSAQLYSIRSPRNWGIGDFGDLRQLSSLAKGSGADFIGLNPLHCLAPRGSGGRSPYSPASRLNLNALYLDIERAAQLLGAATIKKRLSSSEFQKRLESLRCAEFIPYREIAELKFEVLEELYTDFCQQHLENDSILAREFKSFVRRRGQVLQHFANYATIQEYLQQEDPGIWGWPLWPEKFQDPYGKTVQSFCKKNKQRVRFYQFAEWLAEQQLAEFTNCCQQQGMSVGLYLDLAVGASVAGSEAWTNQDIYSFRATMGAPPDKLAPQGQNWGLPPYIPNKLRSAGYAPFIEVLRANMRFAGALRIDHVMALQRLYWVPEGKKATAGAYVSYHLNEMLAIVALESQRNQCIVIGEDLGTVPDEVRQGMKERKLLSYKVLYFMKDYSHGSFLPPKNYPAEALVVASTHDLPTVSGYFAERDLDIRTNLKLHSNEVLEELRAERSKDIPTLVDLLKQKALLNPTGLNGSFKPKAAPPEAVFDAIHLMLAQTPCLLQGIQLEDLMRQLDQVNLPGTTTEHQNWRRRLPLTLEELFSDTKVQKMLQAVLKHRAITLSV